MIQLDAGQSGPPNLTRPTRRKAAPASMAGFAGAAIPMRSRRLIEEPAREGAEQPQYPWGSLTGRAVAPQPRGSFFREERT